MRPLSLSFFCWLLGCRRGSHDVGMCPKRSLRGVNKTTTEDSVAGRRRDLARLRRDPGGSEAPPALVPSGNAVAPRERRGSCGNTAAHAKTREALHHARVGTKMRPKGPHRVYPTRTVLQLDGSRGFETPGIRSIGQTARSQTGKRTRSCNGRSHRVLEDIETAASGQSHAQDVPRDPRSQSSASIY